jgi:molybdopterin-guanine dinucleotide biosynthesis protein
MRILCVAGRSGTGKTTLIERLISHLPLDPGHVGLLKHTHHALEWHPAGKDSTRFRDAGVGAVAVSDPVQRACFVRSREVGRDPNRPPARRSDRESSEPQLRLTRSLAEDCRSFPKETLLILAEGYTRAWAPKLWVVNRAPAPSPQLPPRTCAIVSAPDLVSAWREAAPPVEVWSREDLTPLAARVLEWAVDVHALERSSNRVRLRAWTA